jgi:hypothetical protein
VPRFAIALVVTLAALGFTGCRTDEVTLAFQPAQGTTYAYATTVDSTTHTELPGTTPADQVDHATITSREHVLEVNRGSARVEVVLERPGTGQRTYVMRFDRAAQLTKVETVEGIPVAALGDVGLDEIFPPAAGAPPDHPLRQGDRWDIDDMVQLDATDAPVHLTGTGQLLQLGVVDGRRTATVHSTTSLPVRTLSSTATSTQALDGEQITELTVTYDLADGAVAHVAAVTTARYTLTISPPAGQNGTPIVGSLTVIVRSETTRR